MKKIIIYDNTSGYARYFKKNLKYGFTIVIINKSILKEDLEKITEDFFLAIVVVNGLNDFDILDVLKKKATKTIMAIDRSKISKLFYDRSVVSVDLFQCKREILKAIENVIISIWNKSG